jgi:hypothetical protein
MEALKKEVVGTLNKPVVTFYRSLSRLYQGRWQGRGRKSSRRDSINDPVISTPVGRKHAVFFAAAGRREPAMPFPAAVPRRNRDDGTTPIGSASSDKPRTS